MPGDDIRVRADLPPESATTLMNPVALDENNKKKEIDISAGNDVTIEREAIIAAGNVTLTKVYPEMPPPMRAHSMIGPSNFFVGREDKLEAIKDRLNSGNGAPLAILHGMSGAGKSEIAHQYENLHQNEYDITWVIDASNLEEMDKSFRKLGNKILGKEDKQEMREENTDATEFVLSRLHDDVKKTKTLLILDGLNGGELFEPYFKKHELDANQIPHIHTIITTSKRDLMIGHSQARIHVEMLDDKSAVDLILKIIDGRNPNINDEEALRLANKLGNHPLAITHAATHLGIQYRMNVDAYIKEYNRFYKEAKKTNTKQPSVYATLRASIDEIEKKLKGTSTVLTFVSFFGNKKIPSSIFDHINSSDKKSIRSAASRKELEFALCTPSRVEKALEALEDFSIIHFDQLDEFSMHPLVQVVSQDFHRQEEKAWKESMLEAAILAFPKEVDRTNINSIKDIVLCAQKVIDKFPAGYKSLGAAHVYYLNAAYHSNIARYDVAIDQIQKAINIYNKSSMPEDLEKLADCKDLRDQIGKKIRSVQSTSATYPPMESQLYSTPASSTSQITRKDLTDLNLEETPRPSSTYTRSLAASFQSRQVDEEDGAQASAYRSFIAPSNITDGSYTTAAHARPFDELYDVSPPGTPRPSDNETSPPRVSQQILRDNTEQPYAESSQRTAPADYTSLEKEAWSVRGEAPTHAQSEREKVGSVYELPNRPANPVPTETELQRKESEEAVAAHRAALEESSLKGAPLDWARMQNNLADALTALGELEAGTKTLNEAVVACRRAQTRENLPAWKQYKLDNALRILGELEMGTTSLKKAVEAFSAALIEAEYYAVKADYDALVDECRTDYMKKKAEVDEAQAEYKSLQNEAKKIPPWRSREKKAAKAKTEIAFQHYERKKREEDHKEDHYYYIVSNGFEAMFVGRRPW